MAGQTRRVIATVLFGRVSRTQHQQSNQELHPSWSAAPYFAVENICADRQVNFQSHWDRLGEPYPKARFGTVLHDTAYCRGAGSV